MPVARIYVRVSSDSQTVENQRAECLALAERQPALGFEEWYEETESAAKARPVFERLKREARSGDVVVVWALDRLGRSMQQVINDVLAFDARGVRVLSVRETWLDTRGPVRDLLLAVFGWVAEQERARLIDRTLAGLARARSQGKRLGRPPTSPVMLFAAAEAVMEHRQSVAKAARTHEVSESTLRRHLARLKGLPAAAVWSYQKSRT
jgi:putative DNA-invertase from lambdoid prophage Rac